jgi:hypothetical protein
MALDALEPTGRGIRARASLAPRRWREAAVALSVAGGKQPAGGGAPAGNHRLYPPL